jgi:hypothetical protein
MIAVLRILQLAASRHHALLSRAAILLIEDNQGAVAAINSFRSSASDIHAIPKEIFELCSRVDFDHRPVEATGRAGPMGRFEPRPALL